MNAASPTCDDAIGSFPSMTERGRQGTCVRLGEEMEYLATTDLRPGSGMRSLRQGVVRSRLERRARGRRRVNRAVELHGSTFVGSLLLI
jgi:hypothetical protein